MEDVVDPFGVDVVAEHNATEATAREMERQVAALREAFALAGLPVTREVLQLWLYLLSDLIISATAHDTTAGFGVAVNGETVDAVAVRIAAVVALARAQGILPTPERHEHDEGSRR